LFGASLYVMTAAARVIADELPTLQKLREAVEGALEGKQEAVELALRHLAGQPMSREEALAMRGAHAIDEPPADESPRGAA